MALAGILRRSRTEHCALGFTQVVAQRDGFLFGAFSFSRRWTAAARVFSSEGSGSDIAGIDLVNTKSQNGVTEGKVPGKSSVSHVWVETNEQRYLASRIGALLTGNMKGAAESYIGRSVLNDAVALPSYFSNM